MTLDRTQREAAAAQLRHAALSRRPAPRLSTTFPGIDEHDAYAIQRLNVDTRVADGARVVGHKVGLTSSAMQLMFGVDQPDFGHLLGDMVHVSGTDLPAVRFVQPKVEIEVAFVFAAPLGGAQVTADEVLGATSHVLPAIEVIDSRFAGWDITFVDTVADNASAGAVVVGTEPVSLDGLDLGAAAAELHVNGQPTLSGSTEAVLGHPARAVAWLANRLHSLGVTLQAGDLVLPGSCTAAVDVQAGDRVTAMFAGIGEVAVTFS